MTRLSAPVKWLFTLTLLLALPFGCAPKPTEPAPDNTEPEVSEPEIGEPETSEPETSEPETSEPETSEPETSEPETSEPETTEPTTGGNDLVKQLDQLVNGKAISDDQTEEMIVEALGSDDTSVRWHAARTAGALRLKGKEILEKLRAGVADKEWLVQLHSMRALASLQDKSDATLDALIAASVSENPRVAVEAIKTIRAFKVDPARTAKAMNDVLGSENHVVATYVVGALVEAGPKAVPFLKEALKQPKAGFWACVAIAEIGSDAAEASPELMAHLKSIEMVESVPQALMAVAEIGQQDQELEAAVCETMDKWNEDSSVQLAGLYALGTVAAKKSTEALDKTMEHVKVGAESEDAFVAMVGSWALAMISPEDEALRDKAIESLVAGLESENPNTGHAAAHGLLKLDLPRGMVAPYLLKAAENPEVRDNIVTALASIGVECIPRACEALKDPETRDLALDVLEKLGADAVDATDSLAECIDEKCDALTCERINFLIAAIGPGAASATEKMVEELKSEDPNVRHSAMYALREIGPGAAAAKAALVEMIESVDLETSDGKFDRFAAAWVLARVSPEDETVVAMITPIIGEGLASPNLLDRTESLVAIEDLGAAAKALVEQLNTVAEKDSSAANRNTAKALIEALK